MRLSNGQINALAELLADKELQRDIELAGEKRSSPTWKGKTEFVFKIVSEINKLEEKITALKGKLKGYNLGYQLSTLTKEEIALRLVPEPDRAGSRWREDSYLESAKSKVQIASIDAGDLEEIKKVLGL